MGAIECDKPWLCDCSVGRIFQNCLWKQRKEGVTREDKEGALYISLFALIQVP